MLNMMSENNSSSC